MEISYIAANSGGGIFLVFYILFVLLLGVPIMMAEMSIGRRTQLNAIGAYRKLNKSGLSWAFWECFAPLSSSPTTA